MAFEISIPRLGWSMEEGTFVRWLKKDGDIIRPGDAVFELEGEKAAQDIEAVDSGILRIPATAPAPGTIVKVGAVIGYLVAEGESLPAAGVQPTARPTVATAYEKTQQRDPVSGPSTVTESSPPAAAPSVRRLAREMKVKLASLAGTGPAGRITAEDVRSTTKPVQSPENARSVFSSPRARRVAKELGINWHTVPGTGKHGRVREADIRRAAANGGTHASASVASVSSRRRTILKRMEASRDRTVPVTLTTKIDATNLVGLRNQFKLSSNDTPIPSYSDIVIKLIGLVLQQHPMLAVREEGDRWVTPGSAEDLHIGLAVDTDDGLVVPVVRNVSVLGLMELSQQTSNLIERARGGKLTVAEMQGAVFTVTNLGAFGIDAFTPIINLPETAVLGLGRIRREPVVIDDRIEIRDQMMLSLTFDHRIVDGAPAARFLQTVSTAFETPSAWLLRGIG